MTNPQIILDERGNPEFAVIPWQKINQLAEAYSEIKISDDDLYNQARIENEESFPTEVLTECRGRSNTFLSETIWTLLCQP